MAFPDQAISVSQIIEIVHCAQKTYNTRPIDFIPENAIIYLNQNKTTIADKRQRRRMIIRSGVCFSFRRELREESGEAEKP